MAEAHTRDSHQRLPPLHSRTSESKRRKLVWALWSKTGRTEQVELSEKLVQGLHDLVPRDTEQSTRPLHEPDSLIVSEDRTKVGGVRDISATNGGFAALNMNFQGATIYHKL
ncbi:hypothetical protein B0T24DRAFT_598316 [Lasiosphaeria ovina]|uniref:Uncharacterized protein n=1 Tax=Lasiosphaeria ovina TaxID=92902 RepID=A0AAE0MZT7_9PEZI|nr:hypothetical protein B0T24DRAFT_598316 [Lasiosphaeria ovina]